MATLKQYEQFLDAMWVAYLTVKPDKKMVRENVRAIEVAYKRIDKLKWDQMLEQLLLDLENESTRKDGHADAM